MHKFIHGSVIALILFGLLPVMLTGCVTAGGAAAGAADAILKEEALAALKQFHLTQELERHKQVSAALASTAEALHRTENEKSTSIAKQDLYGNASGTALREFQGNLNAKASGDDISTVARLFEEMRAENARLRAAQPAVPGVPE